ncbi:MAG: GtrA family protein [Planctomycetota bacterium]|mgnify:CR=1 FL=1|nr:MAG: GtrA family protein [Planctomycetota bacterium]REJ94458.1 MAG: GtrA family protein [Planctomycetota bacterium]REK22828.1 MAG: GtrA family protein [Planctomycetota bacterium]REK32406.1 MAG: GtrA family protein [Planctomycetota bacterium]
MSSTTATTRQREAGYLLRFCLVGASGFCIDLAAFFGLRELGFDRGFASALAIWVAMSSNYCWNRLWTFSDRGTQSIWRQYAAFCLSCLLGASVNWSTRVLLWTFFPDFFGRYELAAIAAGVAMGTASNFLLCRLVVFRKTAPLLCSAPESAAFTTEDETAYRHDREPVFSTPR